MDYDAFYDAAHAAIKAANPDENRFFHQHAAEQATRAQMEKDTFGDRVLDGVIRREVPKQAVLDKLWTLAWDAGHSSGCNEVFNYYDDFADLVKLAI